MGLPTNDAFAMLQAHVAGAASIASTEIPTTINLAPYSNDFTWAYYLASATASKTGVTKTAIVNGRPITLFEIASTNAYGSVSWNATASGYTPFVAGKPYLLSCYIWSPVGFWHMHRAAGSYNHGLVWCRPGELTRIWWVGYAASTSTLDLGSNPTAAPGSVVDSIMWILFGKNKSVLTGTDGVMPTGASPYIGGLQIEGLPTGYSDGIALIGDSTMAGASGWVTGGTVADNLYDFNIVANREVSTVLGSELRLSVFNRAIGGQRLDQLESRWATDITPLKSRCNACIIQGGINDILQGYSLASMQNAVSSMTAQAKTDGFKYIYYLTCTPFVEAASDSVKEEKRIAFNAWLKTTYGTAVADIASVVTDTGTGNSLVSSAYGDGKHYPGGAKTAVAAYIAKNLDWSWRITPGAYIPSAA